MGKSQKNNKKEYRVLNGSLDLIEYYQIFGCARHISQKKHSWDAFRMTYQHINQKKHSQDAFRMTYRPKEAITGCFPYDKTKANSVKRLKAT
jgi:hypothetical protein